MIAGRICRFTRQMGKGAGDGNELSGRPVRAVPVLQAREPPGDQMRGPVREVYRQHLCRKTEEGRLQGRLLHRVLLELPAVPGTGGGYVKHRERPYECPADIPCGTAKLFPRPNRGMRYGILWSIGNMRIWSGSGPALFPVFGRG